MKRWGLLITLIAGITITLSFEQINDKNTVAIVELFTSQGCSSCPSADELLTELSEKENVLALSFHVSYWNYLGWKDPYSSDQFTERQRAYARKLNLSSIYTPQMIVNGKDEFVGSNRARAENTLRKAKCTQQIKLAVEETENTVVRVNYSLSGSTNNKWLNVALVERHVQNKVPRGENRGKVLKHDNVVRVFQTLEARASGKLQVELPEDLILENAAVVVYIQNEKTFEITGGSRINL